jgi:hypothetical protein
MKQFLIEIPVYLYLNLPSSNEGFIELYYKHVRYYKSYAIDIMHLEISNFLHKSINIIPMYHKCCGTHTTGKVRKCLTYGAADISCTFN